MIDRLFTTLQVIATKDVRGNLSPEEFNLLINNVIQEKYEEYFFDLNRSINKQNRGLGNNVFAKVPDRIRDKIRYYYDSKDVSITSGVYNTPDEARYVDYLEYNGKAVDVVKNGHSFQLASGKDTRPVVLELGRSYMAKPTTVAGDMTFYYLRQPATPKWTYDPDTEIYNPDAADFQDVDMHPSEEQDILRRLVVKAGVNLNDQELAQYGMVVERKEFEENNVV